MRRWKNVKQTPIFIFASSRANLECLREIVSGQAQDGDAFMSVILHSFVNNLGEILKLMPSLNHQHD